MAHTSVPGAAKLAPPLIHPGPVGIDAGDRRWKKLTEQANNAYSKGDIPLAKAAYEDALIEADRLFAAAIEKPRPYPAPAIYNVSCHNLAELEDRGGNVLQAERLYRKACDQLLDAARSPETLLATRIACAQHLKPALFALVEHLRAHGHGEDAIDAVVHPVFETVTVVFRVAFHARQAEADCPHCPIKPS